MFNLRRSLWVFTLSCVAPVLFSMNANAQGAELFVGYQFTHLQPAFNGSGFNVAVAKNVKSVFGVAGDFSAGWTGNRRSYTYTGGPVLSAKLSAVQPFAHALFGAITTSNPGTTNVTNGDRRTGFAMFLGGGLDMGWRNGLGIRVVQVDWLRTDVGQVARSKNFRASAGIVWKF